MCQTQDSSYCADTATAVKIVVCVVHVSKLPYLRDAPGNFQRIDARRGSVERLACVHVVDIDARCGRGDGSSGGGAGRFGKRLR